jgi:hypothetical protein
MLALHAYKSYMIWRITSGTKPAGVKFNKDNCGSLYLQ